MAQKVYVKFRDGAGLWSEAVSDTITLDTLPPTGTIVINNGAEYTKSTWATLTLSATDVTPVTQMQFSNDGSTWTTPEAYAPAKSWPLTSGDGTKTVYVKYKDTVGLWSDPIPDSIILDTTAPTITNTDPVNGATNVPVNKIITITFNENIQPGSNYESITVNNGKSNIPRTLSVSGNKLTITAALIGKTRYLVTSPAGTVNDLAGNPLSLGATFKFTTGR